MIMDLFVSPVRHDSHRLAVEVAAKLALAFGKPVSLEQLMAECTVRRIRHGHHAVFRKQFCTFSGKEFAADYTERMARQGAVFSYASMRLQKLVAGRGVA